jgi:hypothetical protein
MTNKKVNNSSLPTKHQILILDYLIEPSLNQGETWKSYLERHPDVDFVKAKNRKQYLRRLPIADLVKLRNAFKKEAEQDADKPSSCPSPGTTKNVDDVPSSVLSSSASTATSTLNQSSPGGSTSTLHSTASPEFFRSAKMSRVDKIQNIIRAEEHAINFARPEENYGILAFMSKGVDYKGLDVDVVTIVAFVKDPNDVSRTKLIVVDGGAAVDFRVSTEALSVQL